MWVGYPRNPLKVPIESSILSVGANDMNDRSYREGSGSLNGGRQASQR